MDELTGVGIYSTARAGLERCLVLLALDIPCWLVPAAELATRPPSDSAQGLQEGALHPGIVCLMVEPPHAAQAAAELQRFERESVGWPPPPPPVPPPASRALFITPLLWALTLSGLFWGQNHSGGRWEAWGALDGNQLYRHGQWWRPLTALFLHADASHFLSNLVAGVFVFAAVVAAWGAGRGWLLLAAAGVGGNLLVGAVHAAAGSTSLGSSTALFGAVGLLAGGALRGAIEHRPRWSWRTVLVPLAAGLTVLALYGAGGPEVDVAAHAAGFTCGAVLGLAARGARPPGALDSTPLDVASFNFDADSAKVADASTKLDAAPPAE
jgi:membrane associated rhomboid family serine protease